MGKKDYLKPEWQKKRLDILNRDDFTCQICKDKDSTLHVHHRYYLKDNMPWEYIDSCFVTLCEKCHSQWHEIKCNKIFNSSRLLWLASLMDSLDEYTELGDYPRAIIYGGFGGRDIPGFIPFDYTIKLDVDFIDIIEFAMYIKIPWENIGSYIYLCNVYKKLLTENELLKINETYSEDN